MNSERRHAAREPMVLPLRLGDGRVATTRDISPDGLYILIEADGAIPGRMQLELGIRTLQARVDTDVLRVEPGRFVTGVALRIDHVWLL